MSPRKFRIFLTGAAGARGSNIRTVAGGDHHLVCLDINPGDDEEVVEGSFTDEDLLRKIMPGCDAVIHTAGLHGENRLSHRPVEFTEVNVVGLVRLLELWREFEIGRFVFSSTMEVLIGIDWALSVDDSTLIVAETFSKRLCSYHIDEPGRASNKRVWVTLPGDHVGGPDGMDIDRTGRLLVANWGGSAVEIFKPDGRHKKALRCPSKCPPTFIF